jgi:ribosomal protein L39E
MTCLRYCNTQWKRNLIKTIGLLNAYPSSHSIFLYKMNRNIYLWMMLRTNNTILSKMLNRLVLNKRLNAKSLKYLEHHSVFTYYDNTYSKIVEILEEKEEETHLKILLVN